MNLLILLLLSVRTTMIARPPPVSLKAASRMVRCSETEHRRGRTSPINVFAVVNVLKNDFKVFNDLCFFHGFPDLVISYLMAPNAVNRLTLERFFTSLNLLHGVLIMIFGFLGKNCIGIECF